MELTFAQIPVKKLSIRNSKGHILAGRGHIPANKGKKWDEYNVPEESRKKILSNFTNEGRMKGALADKKRNNIKIIGIKERKFYGEFESAASAARNLQGLGIKVYSENIRTCCKGKRTSAGGVKWFYESDFEKWNAEIKQTV